MATHSKHVSSWNHWMEWHKRGGSTNTHLQELTRVEKVRSCCGFMHAVRRGDFSRKGHGQVASTTARAAVDHVAATIINGGGEDPRVDGSGKISNLLLRQQRAYKKTRPSDTASESLTSRGLSIHPPTSQHTEKQSKSRTFVRRPLFRVQELRVLTHTKVGETTNQTNPSL